jgi:hypothetical protein
MEIDRATVAKCIEIIRGVRDGFLSPEYATDQPMSSFSERFACDAAIAEIQQEFAMGTTEERQILGKPSIMDEYQASLGEVKE